MQIYGPAHLHGPQPLGAPHHARIEQPPEVASSPVPTDEVEISQAGQLLDLVSQLPEIRQDRVEQIRAAIAEGTYETDGKLSIALGRLLDEIG